MERYQNMMRIYERIVSGITAHFQLEDTGSAYMLNHKQIPLNIELQGYLEAGLRAHVHLMAPLSAETSPETMINNLSRLMTFRDQLRSRGYQQMESFEWYDDGAEIVYEVPLQTEEDISKLMEDFAFNEGR